LLPGVRRWPTRLTSTIEESELHGSGRRQPTFAGASVQSLETRAATPAGSARQRCRAYFDRGRAGPGSDRAATRLRSACLSGGGLRHRVWRARHASSALVADIFLAKPSFRHANAVRTVHRTCLMISTSRPGATTYFLSTSIIAAFVRCAEALFNKMIERKSS
jgi:hypothetical protein